MRRSVLVIALAATLAGCSGSTGTAAPPATTSPAPTESASGSPAPKSASVGGTIALRGLDEGLVVDVTVVKVIDPYQLESKVLVPEKGTRLVAMQLKLTNTGTAAYSDSPANGAVLYDVDDVKWQSVVTGESSALVSVTLSPGGSRTGLVYFQLPTKLRIARFQLTLNSGYGPETGEWNLG